MQYFFCISLSSFLVFQFAPLLLPYKKTQNHYNSTSAVDYRTTQKYMYRCKLLISSLETNLSSLETSISCCENLCNGNFGII